MVRQMISILHWVKGRTFSSYARKGKVLRYNFLPNE